jgi:2-iminobutanoate/2-iminopropanoate deaminase
VLVGGGIDAQTRPYPENLVAVLEGAGLGLDDVVKCKVFLTDMNDFVVMNAAYREYFAEPFPAPTTIGVAALRLGAAVEIEMVAFRP